MSTIKDTAPLRARTTRTWRALDLFRDRGHEIHRISETVYSVPSCTGPHRYEVDAETGICTCPDRVPADEICKHAGVVVIFVVKHPDAPISVHCARHEGADCPRCDGSGYKHRTICAACGEPSGSISAGTGYPVGGPKNGPMYHVRCRPGPSPAFVLDQMEASA